MPGEVSACCLDDNYYNSECFRLPGLRGQFHRKVPRIDSRALSVFLPVTRDAVSHCSPFYFSPDIRLSLSATVTPWITTDNKQLVNYWNSSEAFQRKFSQNLVEESIRPLLQSICSVHLIVSRTSGPKDKKIVSWLHKQLLLPTIGELIELCIYKYLWEFASTITDSQLRPLKK